MFRALALSILIALTSPAAPAAADAGYTAHRMDGSVLDQFEYTK